MALGIFLFSSESFKNYVQLFKEWNLFNFIISDLPFMFVATRENYNFDLGVIDCKLLLFTLFLEGPQISPETHLCK